MAEPYPMPTYDCTPVQRQWALGWAIGTFWVTLALAAAVVVALPADLEVGTVWRLAGTVTFFGAPVGLTIYCHRAVLKRFREMNFRRGFCRQSFCARCGRGLDEGVKRACPACGKALALPR